VVETPKKSKYYATFRVNAKGIKYNVAYIVEELNEKKALSLVDKRAKKDFPGMRSLTFLKIRLSEDNDKEFIEEINDVKPIVSVPKEKPKDNKEELDEFIKSFTGILDNTNFKIYKVVFTPGRKPRKRDLNDGMLVPAKSKQAALDIVKGDLKNQGATELKDKYFNVISLSTQEVLNSKEFKSFLENRKTIDPKLLKIEDSKPELSEKINMSEVTPFGKFKNIVVNMKGLFVESVNLVGVTIFDKAKVHKYKITPKDLEPTIVEAFDIPSAIVTFILVKKQLSDNGNKIYSNVDVISVLDIDTGESKMININDLPLVNDIDTRVEKI